MHPEKHKNINEGLRFTGGHDDFAGCVVPKVDCGASPKPSRSWLGPALRKFMCERGLPAMTGLPAMKGMPPPPNL